MFAEVAARLSGVMPMRKSCSTGSLELAPSFLGARHNYAFVLQRQNKLAKSLEQPDQLCSPPIRANPGYRNLLAAVLGRAGDYDHALEDLCGRSERISEQRQGLDELAGTR